MLGLASNLLSLLKRIGSPHHFLDGRPACMFSADQRCVETMIGRWTGGERNSMGCNDLNQWEVCFSGTNADAGENLNTGFEAYLAQMHPNDIYKELDSIKRQLVTQTPSQKSDIRIKNRKNQWLEVIVCREFSYCKHNGELLSLDIGVFASKPDPLNVGNSQNL